MKRLLTVFGLLLVSAGLVFAGWEMVKEQSLPYVPSDLAVIDANTIVSVGNDGEVIKRKR